MTDKVSNENRDTNPSPVDEAPINVNENVQNAARESREPIALESTKVPDLLAKIVNRISESEGNSEQDESLETLQEQASAARDEVDAEHDAETAAGTERSGTFASVEAALTKLSHQVEHTEQHQIENEKKPYLGDTENMENGDKVNLLVDRQISADVAEDKPEAPWNSDAAEELTAHCEEVGLTATAKDADLLIGDGAATTANGPVSYIYLQPDAQELGQKWFENRFDELAKRFDDVATDNNTSGAALAPLMAKFEALEARLETVLGQSSGNGENTSGGSLHDIELCIAELAAQLEATTSELQRIEGIENQIGEIAKNIANGRDASANFASDTFDVATLADQVAERMAANPMSFAAGSAGFEPGDATGVGELSAAVKEFMRERRNEGEHANAILDTLQQSIIRILDRMDALESSGSRGSGSEPFVPSQAPQRASKAVPDAVQEPSVASQQATQQDPHQDFSPAPVSTKNALVPIESEAAKATDSAEAQSLNRLQRVVGQLEDGEPTPGIAARKPAPNKSEQAVPVASRIRADFIAAARQAAANADQDANAPDTVDTERVKFAAAARKAAAKASKRVDNDDANAAEIDATDDGFSLGQAGPRPTPAAKTTGRTRLLVAALAILAVGLGATKLMMSLSSDAARETLQSNKVQQGSSVAGDKAGKLPTEKVSQAIPLRPAPIVQKVSADPLTQNIKPGTVAYNPTSDGLIRPTAVSPLETMNLNNQSISGGAGSTSRQALPSALVGPLSLRLAAANGNASAEFQVGSRFADGKGVKQDFDEAIKWYRRSAGRGFALSQYRLGTLYERGLGVKKDIQRARVWYGRAAASDNIKAMHNLAVLAASTSAGKPDYGTAASWFTEAAERGLGDSQFNLAILYQNGLGVPQDEAIAYKWFSLAAASGDSEAMKRMTGIAMKLGKPRIAVLDSAVSQWSRKPSSKLANDPHYAGQAWQRNG